MPEHHDEDDGDGNNRSPSSPQPLDIDGPQPPVGTRVFRIPSFPSWGSSSSASSESTLDSHEPKLSFKMSLGLLVAVTVLAGFTAEWLVSAIEPLTSGGGISREFVSLILLPLASNAAEHVSSLLRNGLILLLLRLTFV